MLAATRGGDCYKIAIPGNCLLIAMWEHVEVIA
jgi:hypothetical protein